MQVLIIVQHYPPETGPVRYTYDLARWLARRGDQVTVITALPHYPTGRPHPAFGRFRTRRSIEDGVYVIRIPVIMAANFQPVLRLFGFLSFLWNATLYALTTPRPDLLISSIPPATVSIVGAVVGKLRNIPSILIMRDVEPLSSFQLRGMNGVLARLVTWFFMRVYRAASKIVVIHDQQAVLLQGYGIDSDRIVTIAHGIDLDQFDREAVDNHSCHISRRKNRALALYAGTVGVVHDLETFIEMLGAGRVRDLPVDYVIVGDGERLSACRRVAEELRLEQVGFIPLRPLAEVPGILKQADLLVSSYTDKPCSLLGSKFLEYCAAGKPMLLHGPPWGRTYLETIGNGWSCANGDVDALYAALVAFLENRKHLAEIGGRGRSYAARHLSSQLRFEQWENTIVSLAAVGLPNQRLAAEKREDIPVSK